MVYFPGRLRAPNLATAPGSPAAGEVYYDTALNQPFWWNGTVWVPGSTPGLTTGPTTLPSSGLKNGQRFAYVLAANAIYRDPAIAIHWDLIWDSPWWYYLGGLPLGDFADAGDVAGFGTSTWTNHPSIAVTIPEKGNYTFRAWGEVFNATTAGTVSMRCQFVSATVNTFTAQSDGSSNPANFITNLVIHDHTPLACDKSSVCHLQFFSADSTMKVRRCVIEVTPVAIQN